MPDTFFISNSQYMALERQPSPIHDAIAREQKLCQDRFQCAGCLRCFPGFVCNKRVDHTFLCTCYRSHSVPQNVGYIIRIHLYHAACYTTFSRFKEQRRRCVRKSGVASDYRSPEAVLCQPFSSSLSSSSFTVGIQ